jgi:HD-GYP domain-containing protein (c-di-GMP phosphodiesterase class II)
MLGGDQPVTDTQQLLVKITAFKQRLEAMPRLTQDLIPRPAKPKPDSKEDKLEFEVRAGSKTQGLLQTSLRQLTALAEQPATLPHTLTATARRMAQESRELLTRLRQLADHPLLAGPPISKDEVESDSDPLLLCYREAVALMETVVRMLSALPDVPSVQLRLCEGIEGILGTIRERTGALMIGLEVRGEDSRQLDMLSHFLAAFDHEDAIDPSALYDLANQILIVDPTKPLRLFDVAPTTTQIYLGGISYDAPIRYLAAHGLNTARVVARMGYGDPQVHPHLGDLVLAALLHDLGMKSLGMEFFTRLDPLDALNKRDLEEHGRRTAELIEKRIPSLSRLNGLILQHHERMDGTGYPAGLGADRLSLPARMLAIADVYAALRIARPYRPAQDPRTALAETLMLGERNLLDRREAAKLLRVGFYPVGSVVELADGSVAGVVALHPDTGNLAAALRPVVAVMLDSEKHWLPAPRHVDLASTAGPSIIRTIPKPEAAQLLAKHLPQWVA